MFVVHDTPCLFSSMMSIKSAYGSTLPFKTSLATIHKLAKKAILEFSIFQLLKIVNSLHYPLFFIFREGREKGSELLSIKLFTIFNN